MPIDDQQDPAIWLAARKRAINPEPKQAPLPTNPKLRLRELQRRRKQLVVKVAHTRGLGMNTMPTFYEDAAKKIAEFEHDIAELQQLISDRAAKRIQAGGSIG